MFSQEEHVYSLLVIQFSELRHVDTSRLAGGRHSYLVRSWGWGPGVRGGGGWGRRLGSCSVYMLPGAGAGFLRLRTAKSILHQPYPDGTTTQTIGGGAPAW